MIEPLGTLVTKVSRADVESVVALQSDVGTSYVPGGPIGDGDALGVTVSLVDGAGEGVAAAAAAPHQSASTHEIAAAAARSLLTAASVTRTTG
jgi:hypothetical protein